MEQQPQTIHLAGANPVTLQLAFALAEVNIPVVLWLGEPQYAALEWPLFALPESTELSVLYNTSEQLTGEKTVKLTSQKRGKTWIKIADNKPLSLPEPQFAGVTSVPFTQEMTTLIGLGGSIRAYCDRLIPVLTLGKEKYFARLITKRQGVKAAKIAQIVQKTRSSQEFTMLETAKVAPGLNEALTRTGSLSGAIAVLANALTPLSYPEHGAWQARQAVLAALQLYGVKIHSKAAPVNALTAAQLFNRVADSIEFDIPFIELQKDFSASSAPAQSKAVISNDSAAVEHAAKLRQVAAELTLPNILAGVSMLVHTPNLDIQTGDELIIATARDRVVRFRQLSCAEAAAVISSGVYNVANSTDAVTNNTAGVRILQQNAESTDSVSSSLENSYSGFAIAECLHPVDGAQALQDTLQQLQLTQIGKTLNQVLCAEHTSTPIKQLKAAAPHLKTVRRKILGFN